MFTITLQIDCYQKPAIEDQFTRFITRKGWGKAKKVVMTHETDGVYHYAMDIFVKDLEGTLYELDMMSCGRIEIPPELDDIIFSNINYRIVAMPAGIKPEDFVGIMNNMFSVQQLLRCTAIQTLQRLQQVEEFIGIDEELIGKENPGDDESPSNEIEEVKPKWLH